MQPRLRGTIRRTILALVAIPLLIILLYRIIPPPITPLMLIRLIEGQGLRKDWVSYENMAPSLGEAVIAAEDNLFCEEALGFDFDALGAQLSAWWRGERPRGASTITMQTTKNLLLWPGRDPFRKLLEAWLTPQIAMLWPKRRVLEVYLNIVEFGPGIYGAEAAAHAFFRKPASALDKREASLLAAVLPNPLAWSAARPDRYISQRAVTIERRVGQIRPLLACIR